MILEKSKNSLRNIIYGMANKAVTLLMPFLVRTVLIYTLGIEYLGLNSLFSSILMVLNLSELGFSSAVVFCMYKPIAEDDSETINALLSFYKKVYRYIGFFILFAGIALIPFLPHLIQGTYPQDINLVIVYLVFLINASLSYFLYAYLSSLILAFQREDVISKINIIIMTLMYLFQIAILHFTKNYYYYIILMPLFTVINNIRTAVIAKKMFPEYYPHGTISKETIRELKEKIKGLILFKACYISRNAFDCIFISSFLGLTSTAIYNNYYYILNSVVGITTVFTSSVLAGVGNKVAIQSAKDNYQDMKKLNCIYMWISGWFTACMIGLYQPFMILWVGKDLTFPFSVVILLCLYFYLLKIGDVRYIYEQANGMWWKYRYRSIMEILCNIILNYYLGKKFGVCGIVIATIISLFFINYLYGTSIIFQQYFKRENIFKFFAQDSLYFISTAVSCFIVIVLTKSIPYSFTGNMIRIAICIVIPNLVQFLCLFRTKVFGDSLSWIRQKIVILKS